MTDLPNKRQEIRVGVLFCLLGASEALLIYLRPEQLHAPAWVAYVACSAFGAGGLAVLFKAFGRPAAQAAAALLIPLAGVLIGGWIAFGSDVRQCERTVGSWTAEAGNLECRIAFGIASLLCVVFVAVGVWYVWKNRKTFPSS